MTVDPTDESLRLLTFALERYPERLDVAPLAELVIDSARSNEKRPAWVRVAVPDEVAKQLRGRSEGKDTLLLVRIPGEIQDRAESRIILPNEA